MTFVTKLTLQSGDRATLDRVVDDIRSTAERKGAELKGPHSNPPNHCRVPQYKRTAGTDTDEFSPWEYTVYSREIEIVGHDELARSIAGRDFPSPLHVEVEVEQISSVGSGS